MYLLLLFFPPMLYKSWMLLRGLVFLYTNVSVGLVNPTDFWDSWTIMVVWECVMSYMSLINVKRLNKIVINIELLECYDVISKNNKNADCNWVNISFISIVSKLVIIVNY